MAEIYPISRHGWLGLLIYFSNTKGLDKDIAQRQKTQALKLFRQFLVLKIAMPFAFAHGYYWPLNLKTIALVFVILSVGLPRIYYLGLWLTLYLSFYDIWLSWPFTINHAMLEFVIVFLMCLMPDEESEPSEISCVDIIKILMMSVWFFSGIHKLLDGYYLNGEFFALEALSNETELGHRINHLLDAIGLHLPFISQATFGCCINGFFAFSRWQVGIFVALSWLTILAEIFLPIFLLIQRLRSMAIVCIFIFQGFIAYFSQEIDFAFTAFAIILLFIPKLAPLTYPILAFLLLVVQPWV